MESRTSPLPETMSSKRRTRTARKRAPLRRGQRAAGRGWTCIPLPHPDLAGSGAGWQEFLSGAPVEHREQAFRSKNHSHYGQPRITKEACGIPGILRCSGLEHQTTAPLLPHPRQLAKLRIWSVELFFLFLQGQKSC
eukprot:gene22244-biopygen16234